jgi:hypothetical protein
MTHSVYDVYEALIGRKSEAQITIYHIEQESNAMANEEKKELQSE